MTRAFVGLGANLGERERTLRRAIDALNALPATEVRRVSRLRDTAPVGFHDQPRFLNGVVEVETELSPPELLEGLFTIERSLGRDRHAVPPGGPRTADLDLLLYGDDEIHEPGLDVPHPRLHERRFVLEPLAELDSALNVPGKGAVETLLSELDSAP